MKIVAIVQARLNSKRLPGKVMKQICGIPMIGLLLRRLSLSKKKVGKIKKIKVKSFDKLIKSSKTINLIKFINKNKNSKIFFIMGADNLIKFHKWDQWKRIVDLCKIVVFPRTGYVKKTLTCKAIKTLGRDKILFLRSKKIDISSSKIRENYLKYKN